LSKTERREIILSLLRREEPAKILARRHGISQNTLCRWRDAFLAGGDPMTPQDVYVNGQAMAIPKWQGWARAAKEKMDELMSQEAA